MSDRVLNSNTWCDIEVLSPVFIGGGAGSDLMRGIDYIEHLGKIYYINLNKLIAAKGDCVLPYIVKGGIGSLFSEREDRASFADAIYKTEGDAVTIKAFIKDGLTGRPFLPGSSLKGAIRSHILNYLQPRANEVMDVFGSLKEGTDVMRYFKISDTPFEKKIIVNSKIFNLRKERGFVGGWKHGRDRTDGNFRPSGFNTFYEALAVGEHSMCRIGISEVGASLFKGNLGVKSKEKLDLIGSGVKGLFQLINVHTRAYVQKELAFFEKYPADRTSEILDQLNMLLADIDKAMSNGDEMILKLGAGSGFHAITGDWQHADYSIDGVNTHQRVSRGQLKGKDSAKSRKIVLYNNRLGLMGFVRLRIMGDEELRERERKVVDLARQQADVLEQEEHERRRKAQEVARIVAEKEAHARRYDELVRLAVSMDQSDEFEKLEEALLLYQEAKQIYPNRTELDAPLVQLERRIEVKKGAEAAAKYEEREREEKRIANSVSLAEKILDTPKIGTLLGKAERWKQANGFDVLSASDLEVLKKALEQCYANLPKKDKNKYKQLNVWRDLKPLIGEALVEHWVTEITTA